MHAKIAQYGLALFAFPFVLGLAIGFWPLAVGKQSNAQICENQLKLVKSVDAIYPYPSQ